MRCEESRFWESDEEKKMLDMIQTAKSLGISKDDLNAMMEILYEEEN